MIYNLKYGNTRARVSTKGGELISFEQDGREYIWQGDADYWQGQNPVLFPVLCSLKDNKSTFEGRDIYLPKHGFARKSDFELENLKEDSVTLILKSCEETLKLYPYSFEFRVTHRISEKSFDTVFEVTNTDNKNMIFTIGGHTGFNVPIFGKGSFEDHKIVFDCVENAVNYKAPTGGLIVNVNGDSDVINGSDFIKLDYSMFDNDAIMLTNLKSKHVSLMDSNGHGVRMRISDFKALGIWTPAYKKAPFICLEPWNGLPSFENESGKFEDKPFAVILEPEKKYSVSYTVEII